MNPTVVSSYVTGATSEVDAEKAVNDLFKTLAAKGLVPKSLDPSI